ncbi:MAG: hypothetical protein QM784_11120 [Polyangiaceae bacterium]
MLKMIPSLLGVAAAAAALSVTIPAACALDATSTGSGAPGAPPSSLSVLPTDNAEQESAPRGESKRSRLPYLGAMFDVGFPDGAIAGIAGRPLPWLRLGVGAGSNSVSPGVRGGVSLIPFGFGPSLTVEGGHYFEGDANGTVASLAGASYENSRTAERIGYQYANFHLGLDLGEERFTFFLHGGMSYIHTVLHNANDAFGGVSQNSQGGSTTVVINGDPTVSAWIPSLKLGFIIYVV